VSYPILIKAAKMVFFKFGHLSASELSRPWLKTNPEEKRGYTNLSFAFVSKEKWWMIVGSLSWRPYPNQEGSSGLCPDKKSTSLGRCRRVDGKQKKYHSAPGRLRLASL
jgi:hypothetical protein